MQSSSSLTTSPQTRQRFIKDAYNEREHAVLKYLREKDPDFDVTTIEQLADLSGLSVDETGRTLKVLLKRRAVCIVTLDDYGPPLSVIKAIRVENLAF